MLHLDIRQYHSSIDFRLKNGKRYLFDPIRKKELIVQPEELVRQTWIQFLNLEYNISMASLSIEKTIKVARMSKRFDLIANKKGYPYILFEFKSFKVNITQNTCFQAASYNLQLEVPYIIISNGIVHFAFYIDHHNKAVSSCNNLDFLNF